MYFQFDVQKFTVERFVLHIFSVWTVGGFGTY